MLDLDSIYESPPPFAIRTHLKPLPFTIIE
jgi:hypothetical protein